MSPETRTSIWRNCVGFGCLTSSAAVGIGLALFGIHDPTAAVMTCIFAVVVMAIIILRCA